MGFFPKLPGQQRHSSCFVPQDRSEKNDQGLIRCEENRFVQNRQCAEVYLTDAGMSLLTGEREEYRDFEWLSDLSECLEVLRGLAVLDGLLDKLTASYPLKEEIIHSPEITYRPLLFNLWVRLLLKMEPSFSGISLEQAKSLFSKLRGGSRKPPYRMGGFERTFFRNFYGSCLGFRS